MGALWTNIIDIAVGVMLLISQARGWYGLWNTTNINLSIPYTSISASLNILLTIMIVIRLVLLDRKVRAATGSSTGTSRLCKTIATALIESSALYAASSLLMIGLWAVGSSTTYAFLPALCEVQVCDFPQLRSSGRLFKVTTDRIGHRSTAHY